MAVFIPQPSILLCRGKMETFWTDLGRCPTTVDASKFGCSFWVLYKYKCRMSDDPDCWVGVTHRYDLNGNKIDSYPRLNRRFEIARGRINEDGKLEGLDILIPNPNDEIYGGDRPKNNIRYDWILGNYPLLGLETEIPYTGYLCGDLYQPPCRLQAKNPDGSLMFDAEQRPVIIDDPDSRNNDFQYWFIRIYSHDGTHPYTPFMGDDPTSADPIPPMCPGCEPIKGAPEERCSQSYIDECDDKGWILEYDNEGYCECVEPPTEPTRQPRTIRCPCTNPTRSVEGTNCNFSITVPANDTRTNAELFALCVEQRNASPDFDKCCRTQPDGGTEGSQAGGLPAPTPPATKEGAPSSSHAGSGGGDSGTAGSGGGSAWGGGFGGGGAGPGVPGPPALTRCSVSVRVDCPRLMASNLRVIPDNIEIPPKSYKIDFEDEDMKGMENATYYSVNIFRI